MTKVEKDINEFLYYTLVPVKYARLAKFGDKGIAISLVTLSYFELNETAIEIWDLLEELGTPISVFHVLKDRLDIGSEEQLLNDIVIVCKEFIRSGLWKIKKVRRKSRRI